jgi:ribosomal protein S18 acetylase RimI-like enzyme
MPPRKPAAPPDPDALKRERAGTYRTGDGRFTIEGSSSGWLLIDGEQADELGLPLARGPFATLDAAKAAIGAARSGPAPMSEVAAGRSRPPGRDKAREDRAPADRAPAANGSKLARPAEPRPLRRAPKPPSSQAVVIREIRAVDGEALRKLWAEVGFRGLGDDDLSLARLARRNPGLVLVAAVGSRVVGSALGAWDGRRGWIYHVTTAPGHRRQGIATRLIDQVEAGLEALGCPKVNVMVRDDSDGGAEFWASRGYTTAPARQYGKELGRD